MPHTEILLVRHGESQGNVDERFGGHGPTPLTALGRAQAQATARRLADEGGLSVLVSSDLTRAVETATPIAERTGIAMVRTDRFRERSVGLFTGLTFAEAEARWPDDYRALMRRDPDASAPEGESARDCMRRAGGALDELVERFPHARIAIVSHAFTINLVLRHLLGLTDLGAPVFFQTDNCGLHRIRRSRSGTWIVAALNDLRHLASVSPPGAGSTE
jgi:broad specificity phosphatase PhoE